MGQSPDGSRGAVAAHIGPGEAVRIDARRCGRMIVARRVVAAGPLVPASTAEDIFGTGWRGDVLRAGPAARVADGRCGLT
jgi:hypothetical protein